MKKILIPTVLFVCVIFSRFCLADTGYIGTSSKSQNPNTSSNSQTAPISTNKFTSQSSSQTTSSNTNASTDQHNPKDSSSKKQTTSSKSGSPVKPKDGASDSSSAGGAVINNIQASTVNVEPSNGSASLSVPIELPPGRAGIQPSLAVVYNSNNKQLGNAGVGWSLDLGSIQISTAKGVPHYDGTDIFTMEQNGATQDLVADPNTSGLYHMEVEGAFSNIQYFTNYWIVTDKKGIKYYYGNYGDITGNIQVDPNNSTHIFRWALSKVEDLDGNYMTISYLNDQGQLYPQTISYTGNDISSLILSPYAQVSINYAVATLSSNSYISGFGVTIDQRISNITVSVGPNVQSSYKFTYTTSPDTGRDLLQSVQQTGSDGITTLPAVSFTYSTVANGGSKAFTLASGWSIPPLQYTNTQSVGNFIFIFDQGVRLLDVDGNGYSDFVVSSNNGPWWIANNIVNSFYVNNKNQSWSFNSNFSNSNIKPLTQSYINNIYIEINSNFNTQFIDLNGDGHLDYVQSYQVAWYDGYVPWNAENFPTPGLHQYIWTYQNGNITQDSSWSIPDITFSTVTNWESGYAEGIYSSVTNSVFADVNGNGYPDLVSSPPSGSGQVYLNQMPQGSKSFVQASYSLPSGVSNLNTGTIMADLNGDGLADILNITASSSYFYYNTGNGWTQDTNSPWTNVDTTNCDISKDYGTLEDVNGDGLPDLVCTGGSSTKVYINTGHGWYLDSSWSLPGANFSDMSTQFLSADGSGMPDYLIYGYNTSTPQLYMNPSSISSDLLVGVKNGIGASTSIQYDSDFHYTNTYMPFFTPVVKSTTTSVSNVDGSTSSYTTSYIYANGNWDKTYREFDGFGNVTVIDPQGNYTYTTYEQGSSNEHWLKGLIVEKDIYGNNPSSTTPGTGGFLFSKTVNQWQTQTIVTNSNFTVGGAAQTSIFPYLQRTDNYLYDGNNSATPKQTAQEFTYNQYGDIQQAINDGEIDPTTNTSIDPDRTVTNTTYVSNTTNWIIDLPSTITTLDTNGNQLSKESYFYDGDTSGTRDPSLGRLTTKVNWLGSNTQPDPKTTYTYDNYGNLQSTTDPNNNVTSITYDNNVHLFPIQTKNALNQLINITYYGINGIPLNNGHGLHGLWGQQASRTDENNQTSYSTFDTFGRASKTISPLDSVYLPSETKSYTFNQNYIVVSDVARVKSGTSQTISSVSYYDGLGRQIETKTLGPNPGIYIVSGITSYDSRGLPIIKYTPEFTNNGFNAMDIIDPINDVFTNNSYVGKTALIPFAQQSYDAVGRVIQKTNPDGSFSTASYNLWTTTNIDENGHMQITYADAFGRGIKKEEYMGSNGRDSKDYPQTTGPINQYYTLYATTTYAYDTKGNLVTVTDTDANNPQNSITTTITYDNLNRKIAMNDPDMGIWQYGYDNNSNLIWQKDAKQQVISFTYDALNRLTNKTDGISGPIINLPNTTPQSPTFNVNYNFDDPNQTYGIGRLGSVNYNNGSAGFVYDQLGREVQSNKNVSNNNFNVVRQFDDLDRIEQLQYPDGSQIVYTYNQAGQINTIADAGYVPPSNYSSIAFLEKSKSKSNWVEEHILGINNAYAMPPSISTNTASKAPSPSSGGTNIYVKAINYNTNGQITQIQYGNDITTAYAYDPKMFRLTRIYSSNAQGDTLQDLNYTYDALGQIISVVDNTNSNNSITQTFTYDALNRLLTAIGPYGNKTYAYDAFGNITLKDGNIYTYGQNGAGPHAVSSLSNGTIFKYDANGNMVSMQNGSNLTQYVFDSQNRLITVTVGGLKVASYTYDGDGGRTGKTVWRRDLALYNDGADAILLNNGNPMPATGQNPTSDTTVDVGNLYETETDATNNDPRKTKFIYLGDTRLAAVGSDGTVLYYHTDNLGNTTVMTDQTGLVREITSYDPFGQIFTHEKYGNNFGTIWYYFSGKPLDDETGLIYLGARYYNPSLGRFITPDTMIPGPSNPQNLNRYTYCSNNPVNFTDPSGHHKKHHWWNWIADAFLVIAAVAVAIFQPELVPVIGSFMTSVAVGATAGAAIGGLSSSIMGGNWGMGVLTGAIGGAIFGGIGSFDLANGIKGFGAAAMHAIGGAASGAINAEIVGGNAGINAIIGGLSAGGAEWAGESAQLFKLTGNYITDVVKQSALGGAIGGTASAAMGGSFGRGFARGAETAAIAYTANDYMHSFANRATATIQAQNNSQKSATDTYQCSNSGSWVAQGAYAVGPVACNCQWACVSSYGDISDPNAYLPQTHGMMLMTDGSGYDPGEGAAGAYRGGGPSGDMCICPNPSGRGATSWVPIDQ